MRNRRPTTIRPRTRRLPRSRPSTRRLRRTRPTQIDHLAQLHESGAMTDEEFAAAKAKVLGT